MNSGMRGDMIQLLIDEVKDKRILKGSFWVQIRSWIRVIWYRRVLTFQSHCPFREWTQVRTEGRTV